MPGIEELDSMTRRPIDEDTKEWEPGLDLVLPINGDEIPDFKAWINWNGFSLDRQTGKGHDGFDFAAYLTTDNKIIFGLPPETKVRALADGEVVQILNNELTGGGYGAMVTVEHGADDSGMFSQYIHVVPEVKPSTRVKKGDVIAHLYKDSGENEGRLVHLHLHLVSGWGTRGTSITGGGKNIRTDDPSIIDPTLLEYSANLQGQSKFSVPNLPGVPIVIAHFQKVMVGSK